MEQTVFNPAQMKILQMMSYIKTPQELDNLENVPTCTVEKWALGN